MAAAAKKNNKTKAPAKSGAPAGRRSVSGRTGAEAKTPAMPPEREENRLYRLLGGLACLLLALCTAVSYFQADALLLGLLRQALTGLFGYGYWLWAAAFLAMGLFLLLHREQKALGRVLCTALIPLLAGSLLHLALASNTRMQAASALWREGQGLHGGGVLSGVVEPIGAVLTILAASVIVPALPYLLSFAAGAMLYVVVEELIPEMSQGEHSDIGTVLFAVGFSLMMVLDVALG